MQTRERVESVQAGEVVYWALIFLAFFQLLTDFVAAIYAFGLLQTSLTVEVLAVLLLLSPLLLLAFRRVPANGFLPILSSLVFLCRGLEAGLPAFGRLLISGLGVGAFMLLLPAYLSKRPRRENHRSGLGLGYGLGLAVAGLIALRAISSGLDWSTNPPAIWFGGLIAAAGLWAIWRPESPIRHKASESQPASDAGGESSRGKGSSLEKRGELLAASLGLVAVLNLLYISIISPHVIARWAAVDITMLLAVLGLGHVLFVLFLSLSSWRGWGISAASILVWNIVFAIALVLAILPHQINFPPARDAYPLAPVPAGPLALVPLVLMVLVSPVLLLDFSLFARTIFHIQPRPRALGLSFGVSAAYLLVMIFAHVFTTVYDYIPVVGPLFRDKYWLVYLFACLAILLPLGFLHRDHRVFQAPVGSSRLRVGVALLVAVIYFLSLAGAATTRARPLLAETAGIQEVRVLTFNIQQGYSQEGQKNVKGQLALIQQVAPDLIGLQETDTNRISGGNDDLVRYLADSLDMHSYFGPSPVSGTFGIALLSRFPIENPRTIYLYSQGEQTAAIEAEVRLANRILTVVVTHLGNGGPLVQIEGILGRLADRENVLLMGDFNFRPDSPQYQLTTVDYNDAWILARGQVEGEGPFDPQRRIDHIFLSPDLVATRAVYLTGSQSDHPALIADVSW